MIEEYLTSLQNLLQDNYDYFIVNTHNEIQYPEYLSFRFGISRLVVIPLANLFIENNIPLDMFNLDSFSISHDKSDKTLTMSVDLSNQVKLEFGVTLLSENDEISEQNDIRILNSFKDNNIRGVFVNIIDQLEPYNNFDIIDHKNLQLTPTILNKILDNKVVIN